MSEHQRRLVLFGVMLALFALVAAWSTRGMLDQRSAARAAAADLADCRQIASDIRALRTQDAVASPGDQDAVAREQALLQRIEAASRPAGLRGAWLQEVDHKAPRRVGDSPYQRKPAVLRVRGVSLRQLVTLLHGLTHDSELNVQDLRLRTPRDQGDGDAWDGEATLTYLIYSPVAATPRRGG